MERSKETAAKETFVFGAVARTGSSLCRIPHQLSINLRLRYPPKPMKNSIMIGLNAGTLSIDVGHPAPNVVRLDWRGMGNVRDPGEKLEPFLLKVLHHAARLRAGVEIHMEELEHANSSTIRSLIDIIRNARDEMVNLVFVCDLNRHWQKSAFEALRVFETSDGLVRFRTVRMNKTTTS